MKLRRSNESVGITSDSKRVEEVCDRQVKELEKCQYFNSKAAFTLGTIYEVHPPCSCSQGSVSSKVRRGQDIQVICSMDTVQNISVENLIFKSWKPGYMSWTGFVVRT